MFKKYMSKKVIFKVSSKIIRSRSRSRNSDLRLRRAGAEAIFSAPQHCLQYGSFFFLIFVLAAAMHTIGIGTFSSLFFLPPMLSSTHCTSVPTLYITVLTAYRNFFNYHICTGNLWLCTGGRECKVWREPFHPLPAELSRHCPGD